jgi:hypothetical protein
MKLFFVTDSGSVLGDRGGNNQYNTLASL